MSQEPDAHTASTTRLKGDKPGDGKAAQPDDLSLVGMILGGRYLIEKELGRGGIGVVYLARDKPELLSRLVVVKVLLEQSLRNPWVVNKFRHEVEALSRIDHPGIVGIIDTGELPDGKPYIVMQYVEGETLLSAMRPEGMDLARAAETVRQIGCALDEAHELDIVHRDLKPANVMLRPLKSGEEQAKVIDFGIAKVKHSVFAPSTATAIVVGTLSYMSPEQLRSEVITPASDIYSLGLIAYEMVAGRKPFNPETLGQLLEMQREGVRLKPKDLRPQLPEAAQAAIMQALAFDPHDRQRKASEFGNAFAAAINAHAAAPRRRHAHARPADEQEERPNLKFAHVLYMDIVGYSKLMMGQQRRVLRLLQEITLDAREFRNAETSDHLISLATGDGLALVFFSDPVAPVQCAVQVSHALRAHPEIRLRMGIHTGPVYQVADINANRNVAGGGINTAQRVMDCGDAGHILMSKSVADVLAQLDEWSDSVHDLGEVLVKHGVPVHLFNFYTAEVGNPQVPEKVRTAERPRRPFKLGVAAALLGVVLLGLLAWFVWSSTTKRNEKDGGTGGTEKAGTMVGTEAAGGAPAKEETRGAGAGAANEKGAGPDAVHTERSLVFWMEVQKMRGGVADGKPFASAGREVFASGWKFRFVALPQQDGSMYLINEGPKSDGSVGYWLLYPTPEDNGGRPQLKANRQVETRLWNKFDQNAGKETVWVVWSEQPLPQLDAMVKDSASRNFEIADRAQIDALKAVVNDSQLPEPELELGKDNERTTLKVKGRVLVYPLELSHKPY